MKFWKVMLFSVIGLGLWFFGMYKVNQVVAGEVFTGQDWEAFQCRQVAVTSYTVTQIPVASGAMRERNILIIQNIGIVDVLVSSGTNVAATVGYRIYTASMPAGNTLIYRGFASLQAQSLGNGSTLNITEVSAPKK